MLFLMFDRCFSISILPFSKFIRSLIIIFLFKSNKATIPNPKISDFYPFIFYFKSARKYFKISGGQYPYDSKKKKIFKKIKLLKKKKKKLI
jgi:hypothetical protein